MSPAERRDCACNSTACARAQEIERRKYETEEEKVALIPELRGVSRQEYLKKREEQKLAELKEALEDEERLFEARAISAYCVCLLSDARVAAPRFPALAPVSDGKVGPDWHACLS